MEFLLAAMLWLSVGHLDQGRCSICRQFNLKSTVTVVDGGCTSTLMACGGGVYDEEGAYHPPTPCNTTTCSRHGSCSRGHRIQETLRNSFY